MRRRIAALLGKLLSRPRYATGGTVSWAYLDDDQIPAFLSPGRSTTVRPGESLLEATRRLHDGRDL